MAEMFKHEYDLLPAGFDRFQKSYKQKNPTVIVKYIKKDDTTYAVLKGKSELAWSYDNDEYKLYIDEKMDKYFRGDKSKNVPMVARSLKTGDKFIAKRKGSRDKGLGMPLTFVKYNTFVELLIGKDKAGKEYRISTATAKGIQTSVERIKEGNMNITEESAKEMAQAIMNTKKKVKKADRKETNEENWETVPVKEKYALLSKIIFDTKDLTHIGAEVAELTEKISETIISESDGDWFDKHTLKRNSGEITKKGKEFQKSASELKGIFERMQALYEEIGMLIDRYL